MFNLIAKRFSKQLAVPLSVSEQPFYISTGAIATVVIFKL
jgi:hypothetical protein